MIKSEYIADAGLSTDLEKWKFAADILQQVSRTFALNIQVLPRRLRKPVLLAYLFCRIADTVEDDPHLSAAAKENSLNLLSQIFTDPQNVSAHTSAFLASIPQHWAQSENPDEYLCMRIEWILPLYEQFSPTTQTPIVQCIREMTAGMAQFAHRQERQSNEWLTIASESDLDDYCYFVAGVVGNMLCDLFFLHSPFISRKRYEAMRKLAVSFGLGLQVTNIVKDIKEDSQRQVCFIPQDWVRSAGFNSVEELFNSSNQQAQAQLVVRLVSKAERHLGDAIKFTTLIPAVEHRMRLFCLWPLFMATETLVAVGDGTPVLATDKVKITRSQVKDTVKSTWFRGWSNSWINGKFSHYQQSIAKFIP